jgi:16S rRNA (guanine966-N2)-methyltransferase
LITSNLKSLGIVTGFRLIRLEASKALRQLQTERAVADLVFLDPPYRMRDEYGRVLGELATSNLLCDSGQVIVEHERKFDPGESFGRLQRYRKLEQGDAALSFYAFRRESRPECSEL